MTQPAQNQADEKTVLAVFPSPYALSRIPSLQESISKALKIKDLKLDRMRRNGSLIVLETPDPVLASSAVASLFGIDRVAIAREVPSAFNDALAQIVSTSMSLLSGGDKFYLKVDGTSPGYLPKDLEVAATASLIEKAGGIQARPGSESDNTRMLYTHLAGSRAYICIFVDRGLGGLPYGSQAEPLLCCIYDELSAIACLQCIKMGFDVTMIICYSGDVDLLKTSKMINRILPSVPREKLALYSCRTPKEDALTRIFVASGIMISMARPRKIRNIALPILPLVIPPSLVDAASREAFKAGLLPWLPLSGMDSAIIENARQMGLDKFLAGLGSIAGPRIPRKAPDRARIRSHVSAALKTLRPLTLSLGPKNVYDIIDQLRTNH
ncbi:MAG: hypothetical protein KGI33_06785 [Thaumarchaeota archaeon]|nr:hypothetical protein [Nitrososphaerota archaeon]